MSHIDCKKLSERPASFIDEANDCTVRALEVVTGWTYAKAHAVCKGAGRQAGKGASWWMICKQGEVLREFALTEESKEGKWREVTRRNRWGDEHTVWMCDYPTVAQCVIALDKKVGARCVLVTGNHVIAYRNGCIHDAQKRSRARVMSITFFKPRGVE